MKKSFVALLLFLFMLSLSGCTQQPEFIVGLNNLLNDATSWIMGLIPIVAGLMLGYQALMKQFTDDDAVVAKHNRAMKNILVAAVIGISAVGIVKALLAYFQ